MSEFMKSIVEDVLNRNKPVSVTKNQIEANPGTNTTNEHIKPQSTVSPIEKIKRPNYQRDKQRSRIETQVSEKEIPETVKPAVTANQSVDSMSQLTVMTFGQGNYKPQQTTTAQFSKGTTNIKQEAELIGRTSDSSIWFFPEIPEKMKCVFSENLNNYPTGIVSSKRCYPGQLFLVNEILKEAGEINYNLKWPGTIRGKFVFQFSLQDEKRLMQLLNKIYQTLKRHSVIKNIESHTALHPSPWLLKQLEITKTYNMVAVIEGMTSIDSAGIIDRFLKRHPANQVTYEIKEDYFLLMGDAKEVTAAVQSLKKEATRLLD